MKTLLRRGPTNVRAAWSASRVASGRPIGMSMPTQTASSTRASNAVRSRSRSTSGASRRPRTTPTQPALYQSTPRTHAPFTRGKLPRPRGVRRRERRGPRGDVDHLGLAREDLLEQDAVDLVVGVGARVAQDGEAEVEVGGLAQRRQDDAAGRDAAQRDVLDVAGAEHDVEVAARERAHAALDDDDLARLRRERGMDRGRLVVLAHRTGVAQRAERAVARADLRVAGAERDAHVDHRHLDLAGRGDRAGGRVEHGVAEALDD